MSVVFEDVDDWVFGLLGLIGVVIIVVVVEIINLKIGVVKFWGFVCVICLLSWCFFICVWSVWEFVFVVSGEVVLNCIMDIWLFFLLLCIFGVLFILVNS